ncbi:hypothetical protein D3C72_1594110 [compost metagenome]
MVALGYFIVEQNQSLLTFRTFYLSFLLRFNSLLCERNPQCQQFFCDFGRIVLNMFHKNIIRHFIGPHFLQLLLPFTGQSYFGNGTIFYKIVYRKPLFRWNQFFLVALNIITLKKCFDGCSTRSRCTKSTVLHGLSHLIVFNFLSRGFHGLQ